MKLLYKDSGLINKKDIQKTGGMLMSYLEHLKKVAQANNYDFDESSINLPFDKDLIKNVTELKGKKGTKGLKYIIVIGIGGSVLGAKAIYDAFYGYFDSIEPNRFPKMIFADTNDPEFLFRLGKFLEKEVKEPSEILVNVISKSGGTIETIVNLEILGRSFKKIKERLVITTALGTKLWKEAEKQKIDRLLIPEKIGGRYSMFSAVGLFPLSSLGLDVDELLTGAVTMRDKCLRKDIIKNPAALSAIIIFLQHKKGKIINDNFFFHPELESVGKWLRQLLAESLGKEKDIYGKVVNAGLTPTVSIGSIDLHSTGQLYLGGPRDKFTVFIESGAKENAARVPRLLWLADLAKGLENKPANEVMSAILEAVKISYKKIGLPFIEIVLSDLSLKSLGEFLQFKMMEIMFLGKLLKVNAFDQPNVEFYKAETKRILDL